MDRKAESPGISRRDVLYRLALLLELPWPAFKQLELWELRNRAWVCGETVVEEKIARLDAAVTARSVKNSKEPGKAQQEFEDWYRKAITVTREKTPEEMEEVRQNHNQSFFNNLNRNAGRPE